MSLTVEDINNKRFDNKMRGYNPSEVNEFLRQVANDYQALLAKNYELTETIKANEEKLKYFTDLKDSLNKSILVAQEAADKVKNNARREADIMIREAQKQATDIVSEANAKANQVVENSADETRKLTTETNDLKKQTRIFRQRLQVMLESQLEVVKSKDWDDLLANDDLSRYDEIQKILGSGLDNHSTNSVESQSIDQPVVEEEPQSVASQASAAFSAEEITDPVSESPVSDDNETIVVFPDSTTH